MPVKRRLVIYVQGYDPRGLAEYYRMFRREYRRTCDLYGLAGSIGRAENDPNRFITTWDATTAGDDWRVDTRYMFLRWEDIIRRDFARPSWLKIALMFRTIAGVIGGGTMVRLLRAHWRFGLFILYPPVLMIFWMALGTLAGFWAVKLAAGLGAQALIAVPIGAASGLAVFAGALWLTERQTYLLYLCDDGVSTYQFAHGRRPDWEERMETFAGYVVNTVRDSDADEIVIVGHSSGSFLAVDVLDRAILRDPALGRHGPKLALLTIGANLPIIGFHPRAQWFRDRIKRLALVPDLVWVDYQSRHDIMNFWPFDPVAGHGITLDAEQRNHHTIAISFRDLWIPGDFARRRWRFFRAHFQFLHAKERLGSAYDYYLICCGPLDLVSRATHPAEAVAAITAKSGLEPEAPAGC